MGNAETFICDLCQRHCLCNSKILSSRRSALIRQPSCERVSSRGWVSMFPLSAWLWDQVGWVRGSHCHHKIKSLTAVFNIYQNSGNFTSKVIPKKENSLVNKLKKCIHFDYSNLWKRNWGVHFKPHPVRVALLIQTDPVRCDQLVNRPKSLTQCFDVKTMTSSRIPKDDEPGNVSKIFFSSIVF